MKNHLSLITFCLCLIGAPVSALAQAVSCDEATTTHEMMVCEKATLGAADKELNGIYGAMQADLDKTSKLLLRDAQRAWITYRDAECARIADFARGGTMAPLLALGCKAKMTADRVTELGLNPLTGETQSY
jgi:uncharacterized protein YecT (DUF1311 family)